MSNTSVVLNTHQLAEVNKALRRSIIEMTTAAQSGHPTTALSGVELMSTLLMGGYFDHAHDKLIFSKGHGTPLLYSLYHTLGHITREELMTFRQFGSKLEGHPIPHLPFIDAATGSLGQGLSIAVGMALAKKRSSQEGTIYVLCGDSEMAEGQIYEALQIASHYRLNNITLIIDVNALGQRGETMLGHDVDTYASRISAFAWSPYVVNDGHDIEEIARVYAKSHAMDIGLPNCIIARTIKGKGVAMWEGLNGYHSKQLTPDQAATAIAELGDISEVPVPKVFIPPKAVSQVTSEQITQLTELTYPAYTKDIGTKEVTGDALIAATGVVDTIVSLDAEVSNSTSIDKYIAQYPEHFYEMYIAEQNMLSAAVGLSAMGYIPVITTFTAFLTRAYDQIRMAQYSGANLKIVASYAGVISGMDGPSGMGLEDLSMMRSILHSVVLYPSDAISTCKTMAQMIAHHGISYQRLTREKTPNIYASSEQFPIGGSKVHFSHTDADPKAPYTLIIAAGVTVHEALKAQKTLSEKGARSVVIDAYSVKPIDSSTINMYAKHATRVIVVEDHYPYGGLGDAVRECLVDAMIASTFTHLCVRQIPRSGKPADLIRYEEIDAAAIVEAASTK